MDVKQAVARAKAHIAELFEDEQISNLGLEEVEFDDQSRVWNVTIGFSRPWDVPANPLAALAQKVSAPTRCYKVVSIRDATMEVRSVKNREIRQWAESA
jgi:hypothetical protein